MRGWCTSCTWDATRRLGCLRAQGGGFSTDKMLGPASGSYIRIFMREKLAIGKNMKELTCSWLWGLNRLSLQELNKTLCFCVPFENVGCASTCTPHWTALWEQVGFEWRPKFLPLEIHEIQATTKPWRLLEEEAETGKVLTLRPRRCQRWSLGALRFWNFAIFEATCLRFLVSSIFCGWSTEYWGSNCLNSTIIKLEFVTMS